MTLAQIQEAADFIRPRLRQQPAVGIILGTGLGALAREVADPISIPYEQIPHFPASTVESHKGRLILGTLGDKPVIVMQGRFHVYEGYHMKQVTFPVRVMKLLGIQSLFISNAAGGLNSTFGMSDLMVIEDHINLHPDHPLWGPNIDELGPRFPDMSEPYSRTLLALADQIARQEGLLLRKGVYVSLPGPNLETPAEYRYLRLIGADAVGMSTVPEVIVARHMGLPVFALSVITDLCYGQIKPVTLEEVVAAAAKAEPHMTHLIREMIRNL